MSPRHDSRSGPGESNRPAVRRRTPVRLNTFFCSQVHDLVLSVHPSEMGRRKSIQCSRIGVMPILQVKQVKSSDIVELSLYWIVRNQ